MHMILMLIGVAGAVAGGAMVAMGVMHQDVPLSPTWITSGTIAAVGGFVLIGLGAVVSRLRRMNDLLDRQPVPSFGSAGETIAPMTAPPRGGARPATAPAPSVKPDAAPTEGASAVPPVEAPVVTVEPVTPPAEPAPSLVDKTRDLFEKPVDDRPTPPQAPEVKTPEVRVTPESKAPESKAPESKAPEPKVDAPPGRDWPRMSTSDRLPPLRADAAPSITPPIVPQPERPMPRVSMPEPQAPAPPEPAPNRAAPTVLKSGVIEGMAYTLYSDGSIEAELAQGSMRFDSIPALRAYLRDIG